MSALYEKDFYLWLTETAQLLRDGRLNQLDIPHLVEEVEAMGRSEKRAIESNLIILLIHLLKWQFQPNRRSDSWRYTIIEHRDRLHKYLADSPSLRPYLLEVFAECYQRARRLAAAETGLKIDTYTVEPPFSSEEAVDPEFLPD